MKRKLLSLLLTCAVVLSILPAGVLAAGEAAGGVVEVGTAEALKTALAAPAGGDTTTTKIKLTADITYPEILDVGRNAEIDFAGRTLTLKDDSEIFVKVRSDVTLTVRDTSANPGTITSTSRFATFVAMRGSTLNVEKVTIENTLATDQDNVTADDGGYGVMLNPSPEVEGKLKTSVNLKDLSINAGAGGVYAHGNIQQTDAGKFPVVNLENVTIQTDLDEGAGLYLAGMTDTTIKDCEITATQGIGIGIKAGKLTIKGASKIRGEGEFHAPSANGNGIDSDGSALLIENNSKYAGHVDISIEDSAELTSTNGYAVHEFTGGTSNSVGPKIDIKGGKFTSAKDESIVIQDHTAGKKIITISGGTFNKPLGDSSYLADGLELKPGDGGSLTVSPPDAQDIYTRTKGPEDDDPDADYAKAYQTAGVKLGARESDGSYTLTIDKAKLEKVVEAGKAQQPDENSDLYKAYQVMENKNNPGKLWFGAEYPAPNVTNGTIAKASISFDGDAPVDAALEDMTNPGVNSKGLFNYIQVYTGTAIATNGETALIKWLDSNGAVLKVTQAVVKLEIKDSSAGYTVTFDSDGGSAVEKQTVADGGKATKPADPTKKDCRFDNWYLLTGDQLADTPFDFNTPITSDITLKAKWTEITGQYTITFNVNCEDENDVSIPFRTSVTEEKVLTMAKIPVPTRAGYFFGGWYPDKECTGSKVTDKTDFTKDTTVYAKWTSRDEAEPEEPETEYTVTFDTQGGSAVPSETVEKDGLVPKPADPTRDGYTFRGWYKAADCKDVWDFATEKVTEDVTIYAGWTKIPGPGEEGYSYRVRVRNSSNGDLYTNRWSAEKGDTVTITVSPDRDCQAEWFEVTDANGTQVDWTREGQYYTFTMPAADVTVEAGFNYRMVYRDDNAGQNTGSSSKPVVPEFSSITQRPVAYMPDVSWNSWAYPSIQWAYQNGYLDTARDGTFQLDGPVTHHQMWRIMAQWLGEPVNSDWDVTSWARKIGAAKGSSPSGNMTRQDIVTYLYQCYFLMGGDVSTSGNLSEYLDSRQIPPTSQQAWIWAVERGLITGTASRNLNPNAKLTRAEFADILMRLCQNT